MACSESRFAAVLAAALFSASCTMPPPHPYSLAPEHRGAAGVRSFALLPLNLVVALPEELEWSTRRVSARIATYLANGGREVVPIELHEARSLWSASDVPDARGEAFDLAAARFVGRLGEGHSFDAVVMPSLVYREARVLPATRDVIWDGTKRKLQVVGEAQMRGSIHLMGDFYGEVPAVSLHVLVYDAQGTRVFESYGGLDLVHEADVGGTEETLVWQMRLKRRRLHDEAALREGVALAFSPYLEPSPGSLAP